MAPEGAETFMTVLGKEEVVKFDKPGVYGIQCSPHYLMGMIAVVEAGDKPENLDQRRRRMLHNKLDAKRFEPLLAQVQ